jgi:hypothetical protein
MDIIIGPAIITRNGHTYYSEADITSELSRETWKPGSSIFGGLGERLVSQQQKLSFTPVGALDVVAKYIPWAVANIGATIFSDIPAVIKTKAGQTITWANSAITKLPSFRLSPVASAFSSAMEITCLGDLDKAPTAADSWNTFAAAAFNDTTFDETKIRAGRYTATFGELEDIESEAGFTFEVAIQTQPVKVANRGIVNMLLTEVTAVCRFNPVGLGNEDVIWAMMGLQGADAILPGERLAKGGNDLVITDGTHVFTLHQAGPQKALERYGLTALRHGEVAFAASKSFTLGALNPLFTIQF